MNIKFKKVIIDNFMSIGHAELDLENRGSILVKGINKQEDTSSSNGSGKSALTSESIIWALTGKTNKTAKSINHLYIDDAVAKVTLTFSIDNDDYEITRINDKNKTLTIIKNGQDISGNTYTKSKEVLEKELGFINESVIASIIILGQGMEHRFSKQKASERKATLEYLVGMDSLLENIQNVIDNSDKTINTEITNNNLKIAEQNGIITSSQQVIDSYQNRTVISEEEYKTNLAKYNELSDKGSELQTKIQKEQNLVNQKFKDKDGINNQIISLTQEISKKKQTLSQYQINFQNITNNINKISDQLAQAAKSECPLCHQHLSDKELENHLKAELDKFNKELEELKSTNSNDTINNEIEILDNQLAELNAKNVEAQTEINTRNATINNYTAELNNVLVEYNKYQDFLNAYDKYKAESDSIDQIIASTENKIQEANTLLETFNSKTEQLNQDKEINKFFKNQVSRKFRNFLLEGVFAYINERLEYYSSKLFTDYVLKLENNNSDIDIRMGKKYYEDLSGGEQRKCDIAIQCALRDLARNQRGLSINLMVLDEIFDYLDSLGIETMVKFIEEEITDVNTMFITTHMNDVNISYDSILEVEKGKDEISIIREDK